jgi:uncharacterized membrane protein YraQ (UPF0718 family)
MTRSIAPRSLPRPVLWIPLLLFLGMSVGGLYYVKWAPYYAKAFHAAAQHSIGASILSGTEAAASPLGLRAGLTYSLAYLKAVWQALLLGLALAAGVETLLPRAMLTRIFSGRAASLRAALLGVPSMMCTCCAAPIAVGLMECETSPAAALIYWLANPVLNPATLVFIGFVLGWQWMALRLVLGVALVFALGHWAARWVPQASARTLQPQAPAASSPATPERHFLLAWSAAFLRLAVRLIPEYAVIVFVLGMLRAWLFPEMTPEIGHAAWLAPALAAAGTLFVIPTAGEVPIIQVLQHFGLGPAGAAALLMTLPSVSLPSLAMLGRAFPWRVVAALGFGTFFFGLLAAGLAALLPW